MTTLRTPPHLTTALPFPTRLPFPAPRSPVAAQLRLPTATRTTSTRSTAPACPAAAPHCSSSDGPSQVNSSPPRANPALPAPGRQDSPPRASSVTGPPCPTALSTPALRRARPRPSRPRSDYPRLSTATRLPSATPCLSPSVTLLPARLATPLRPARPLSSLPVATSLAVSCHASPARTTDLPAPRLAIPTTHTGLRSARLRTARPDSPALHIAAHGRPRRLSSPSQRVPDPALVDCPTRPRRVPARPFPTAHANLALPLPSPDRLS